MRQKHVVVSTLSEEVFEDVISKLEDLKVNIIEERYNLVYHRYEIYAKLTLRQSYMLRHFLKSRDANIFEVGA